MFDFLKQKKIIVPIILIVCMLLFIVINLSTRERPRREYSENGGSSPVGHSGELPELTETQNLIGVHITGAVSSPGFYEVERGVRVNDLIQIAGGAAEGANLNAVNLAEFVFDQQQIHIPTEREVVPNSQGRLRINLNTATEAELQQLSGVGEVTARNIIELRQQMGGFHRIEDIMNVRGISVNRFEAMRDYIVVP
jgi:competence protein ComEA